MANPVDNPRFVVYGQANPSLTNLERPFPYSVDSVMKGRKGSLYVLGTPDTQSRAFVLLAEHYYANNDFDILPTLRSALADTYRHRDEYEGRILVAVVVHDLNMYVVSTQEGDVYLARSGTVSRPLQEYHVKTVLNIGTSENDEDTDLPVRSTKARLYHADCLVMGSSRAAVLTKKVLRHAVRHSRDPNDIAGRLAESARRTIKAQLPFAVILLPGLSPISGNALAPKPQHESDSPMIPAAVPPPREGVSPIWLALMVAIIALGATLWLVKPDISITELRDLVIARLTPTPTSDLEPESHAPTWIPPKDDLRPTMPDSRASRRPSARGPSALASQTAKRMCSTSPSCTT